MGYFKLSNEEILFFGGSSDGSCDYRDLCYLLDIPKKEIIKTKKKMQMKDVFQIDGFQYYETGSCFYVAGRYFVHRFCKEKLEWSVINPDRDIARGIKV